MKHYPKVFLVRLRAEQYKGLKAVARKEKKNPAEVIRELIDQKILHEKL